MEDICNIDRIPKYCQLQFDDLKDDVKCIKKAIIGNGADGYNVRIDRLEQSRKARGKVEWTIIACLIVILVNSVWTLSAKVVDMVYHSPPQITVTHETERKP